MSVMEQVQIIPPSLNAGKRETIVVIFPVELPRDVLITLDLAYDRESSSKRSKWSSWVPAQPLGSNSVQAKLPELPHPGQIEVLVKAAREIFSPFPKFRVRVQSPVEAIFHNLSLSPNDTTALACVGAYLLQNTEKDRDTLSHVDVILCNILRSQPSLSDWNMCSIICGKYGQDESLLHLCVRQKLEGAASYLLQNIRGREVFLQQRDHKGKTPSEIARKKGEKRIADMLDKAVKEYSEGPPTPGPGGKLKKSKSLEYEHVHSIRAKPGEEDVGPLPLEVKGQGAKNLKQMFGKIKSKKSKKSKGPVPVLYPSNVPPPEPPANDGPPLPPRSPIATRSYSVGQEPAIIDKRGSTAEPLEQLLSRCIYTATVLVDYYWDSSPFGDQFSLKTGDRVYVIKEIGDDLCQGVCKNFYCMVPKNILGMDTEEGSGSEDYEDMLPEDEYDMIDDDTYEYPEVIPFPDTSIQPPPQHEAPPKVQSFKPPPMKPSIKSPQPNTIPGRLLPNCTLSSSHDTGLDRLGMPRQVSKGKLRGPGVNKPSGGIGQAKQLGAFPSGHTASRSPYEWKSLKTFSDRSKSHRPASKISSPDSDEEYDDATTIQQIAAVRPAVQQQNKDQHTGSASPQPKTRHPATRPASVGSASQMKPHTPTPKPRGTTLPLKSEPPMLQDSPTSPRRVQQTARASSGTAAVKGSPKVSDLKKRFENK